MNIYSIRINAHAKNDIEKIYNYIATDLESPESAKRLISEIYRKVSRLKLFPEGSPKFEFLEGIRVAHTRHYSIFFQVERKSRKVIIVRVLHGAKNVKLDDIKNS